MHNREKSSILSIVGDKTKSQPSFTRKVSEAEVEALLHRHVILEEDINAEYVTESEDSSKGTSILVKSKVNKNEILDDLSSLISTIRKKTPNSKTKV